MIVINNNSGLTECHYSGTSLSEIYVGRHLVWPVPIEPTPPVIGNKLTYTMTGSTYTIPCNETDILSNIDIIQDIIDRGEHIHNVMTITDAVVGDCVTELHPLCFAECSGLTSITLSNNVTHIDESAFMDCVTLPSITIPSGVTKMSDTVFESDYELASINIPNGVTHIGICSFFDCLSLLDITIPSGVTEIGQGAFRTSHWTTEHMYHYEKMMHMASARTVTCLATTPPRVENDSFSITTGKHDIATYKIYVPAESLNDYKTAPNWSYIADRIYPII